MRSGDLRPITGDERGWLRTMLRGLPPEFDVYESQLDGLLVERECDCGCGTIDLVVSPDAPLGQHERAIVKDGEVEYDDGAGGWVILFIDWGRLSLLEFERWVGSNREAKPKRVWTDDPRRLPSGVLGASEGVGD